MAEEVKLTRKERCQQKKEEKKARRQAEKEFERSAGRKAPKILSLIFGIVGFLVGFIPVILLIFTLLFVIICGFASVVLFIIDIFGLLCFGLGYLIYASQASDASLSGYFAPAAKPIEFGTDLFNKVANINGVLTTGFAIFGLVLEVTALILLFISYPALVKRHKVAYTILLCLALVGTLIILIIGIRSI